MGSLSIKLGLPKIRSRYSGRFKANGTKKNIFNARVRKSRRRFGREIVSRKGKKVFLFYFKEFFFLFFLRMNLKIFKEKNDLEG